MPELTSVPDLGEFLHPIGGFPPEPVDRAIAQLLGLSVGQIKRTH